MSLVRSARGVSPAAGDDAEEKTQVPRKRRGFKKRRARAPRDRPEVREPRNARLNTLLAWDGNNIKSTETLRKYRVGFNFVWRIPKARKVMVEAGFKQPNRYHENNQMGGKMFALPREIPRASRFGEEEAGMVMRHCLHSGGTRSQCENVRKLLSYIHQLQTGDAKGNFTRVGQVWDRFDENRFGEPTQRVRAIYIIEPDALKTSLTKEWKQSTPMPYHQWSLGYLETYDWCVDGLRPKEDLARVKHSGDHVIVPSHGYMYTEMLGGRAKLERAKGSRDWRVYRVCMCPGGKHQGPRPDFIEWVLDGKDPDWVTTCPLTCFQVIRAHLADDDDPRIYPNLTPKGMFSGFGGKEWKSMGWKTMFPFLRRWLDIQDGNPDSLVYDSNMGRHALGKVCDVADISYPESFEITGDKFTNWRHYQERVLNDRNFKRRTQSPDIKVVLKALRKIARWMGRGPTVRQDPETLTKRQVNELLILFGRSMGQNAEVNRILDRR